MPLKYALKDSEDGKFHAIKKKIVVGLNLRGRWVRRRGQIAWPTGPGQVMTC